MSKKSRNRHKAIRAYENRSIISNYIQMLPNSCKGKKLEQIIADYCTMFKKENQLTFLRSLYTKEELTSIILL